MPSLASYDKGTKAAVGRTYRADIDAHLDFNEKLWDVVRRQKRKMPRRIFCVGNHEQRIEKAVNSQPELENTISMKDLRLEDYYDDVVYYEGGTPGIIRVDGIHYAHYFVSGVLGRPIGGEHQASALINKQLVSCTQGHTHTLDFSVRSQPDGSKLMGLVCGVFQDYNSPWAGKLNNIWWRGCVVKRNVDDGQYDPEFVSLSSLEKEFGR